MFTVTWNKQWSDDLNTWQITIRTSKTQKMCPSSGRWGGLGVWFPVYHAESTIVRCSPALTLCEHVFLSTSPYTWTLCPMFSLDPFVVCLANTCTCWRQYRITRSCASHTCVTWSAKSLFFFPSCTLRFLSLVQKQQPIRGYLPQI